MFSFVYLNMYSQSLPLHPPHTLWFLLINNIKHIDLEIYCEVVKKRIISISKKESSKLFNKKRNYRQNHYHSV